MFPSRAAAVDDASGWTQECLQRVKEGEEARPRLQAETRSLAAAAARGAAAEHALIKHVAELIAARDDLLVKIATCATALSNKHVPKAVVVLQHRVDLGLTVAHETNRAQSCRPSGSQPQLKHSDLMS